MKDVKIQFLIFDPQEDFCNPEGSLHVPGAEEDMCRLADLISRLKEKTHAIHVTLDSHYMIDIAHPCVWLDKNNQYPQVPTDITSEDVESEKWRARNPASQEQFLTYVKEIEKKKLLPLRICHPHCLIASYGHTISPDLYESLQEWEKTYAMVNYIPKGSNVWTEHRSALRATVFDPDVPTTHVNTRLLDDLREADVIPVAGESLNWTIIETLKDLKKNLSKDDFLKIVLLEDATSISPHWEGDKDEILHTISEWGLEIGITGEFVP